MRNTVIVRAANRMSNRKTGDLNPRMGILPGICFSTSNGFAQKNSKSEARNSKQIERSKLEIRNKSFSRFGFRIFDFEFVSDFDIRDSNLWAKPPATALRLLRPALSQFPFAVGPALPVFPHSPSLPTLCFPLNVKRYPVEAKVGDLPTILSPFEREIAPMFGKKPLQRAFLAGALSLLWIVPEAQAQRRWFCIPRPDCVQDTTRPPIMEAPTQPPLTKEMAPEIAPEPTLQPITTAALGGATTSVPHMMGDFGGYCGRRVISTPVTRRVTILEANRAPAPPELRAGFQQVVVCDPITSRAGSGFKVADNESPKPTDRVFFTYNYLENLRGEGGFTPASQTIDFNIRRGRIIIADTPAVRVNPRSANVHRELFGFEKTFLDGDASVELRLPFFQTSGAGAFEADEFGDLTIVSKFALINDYDTGNVFSVGLAVTAPSGPPIQTIAGDINSTLLQPYVGYIRNRGNWYFQGIHSVVIPTHEADVTLLFNDLGVGYVIPGRRLAFVAPNVEAHVTTPLNHRDDNGAVHVSDFVTLTGGVHLGLGRSLVSLGVVAPVTSPRPMDLEAFVQFNFRF
jgi:hypothetical protein